MNTLPEQLKVTATLKGDQNIIMAIEHKEKPIYGVQFHPESINTSNGKKLIKNFLRLK
jgi:anthranilate/para-aminobenzoate synthase component II